LAHLEREGLADRSELVGDVMVDAWQWAAERAGAHLPAEAVAGGHILLTLHRAENVDDPARLVELLAAMGDAATRLAAAVVFPVHPRTRAILDQHGVTLPASVTAIGPVGFLEMVALERGAQLIATDSGGVQKEAYLAGVPCITLRTETEWVETVDAGWNRVVATDPVALRAALEDAAFLAGSRPRPELYGDGHAAARIVSALERQMTSGAGHATIVPTATDSLPGSGMTEAAAT
jgi:UDP-N-acetylglucosamine 2-epimerase